MADRTIEVNLRAERSVSGSLMRRLVIALAREEDSDTIRQMATELAESTDFDLGRAFGLQLLARFDGGAQDYAAGAAKADAAVAIVVAAGLRDRARELGQLAGDLWLDAGDAREAAARYRFAIQQADLGEQRKDALVLSLGRALVLAGETDQALETLDPLVWREDDDDPLVVAHALSWIARAYESEGDLAEAGEQWEEAIAAFTQAGQLDDAAAAALRAGRLARIEDEPSDAVGYLDSAVELGTRSGEAHQVVFEAMCEIATLQAETGDTSAVESIEEALRLAEAAEAPWAIAEATDTKARILIQLDRLTESVSLCLQASDLYREAGDAGAAGGAEYTAGQVLMHLGRSTEAVSLLRQALDAPENQPGFLDAVRVLLADALEATGADDEARHLRRLVEAGLPDTVEEPGD
jgi:tetratricopeptide (TPR) repeat protein